jgi:hypothetical protein
VSPETKIHRFLIFVPLASILLFAALIAGLLYSFRNATATYQTIILKFTLAPFVSAAVVWIAVYTNKSQVANLFNSTWLSRVCDALGPGSNIPSIFVQALLAELVRLATLLFNRPDEKYDDSYALYTSCWVAFGWAAAEVVASIVQGYSHLSLYADYTLENDGQIDNEVPLDMIDSLEMTISEDVQNGESPNVLSQYIDDQLYDLLNLKRMFDLEAAYGCPVPVSYFYRCKLLH